MAEAYDGKRKVPTVHQNIVLMLVVAIAPHCPLGPIALAACLHIGISTPNHVIQEMSLGIHYNTEAGEFDIHSYLEDRSVFEVNDGYVQAFTKPGLGIDINEALVREVAMTSVPWRSGGFVGKDGGIREW
jgi:galactonate dehydratase